MGERLQQHEGALWISLVLSQGRNQFIACQKFWKLQYRAGRLTTRVALIQLCIFHSSGFENAKIRIRLLPKVKELAIAVFGFDLVAPHQIGASEL